MKNYIITLIFILISMFTFTSCEKDDSYPEPFPTPIEQIKVTEVNINLWGLKTSHIDFNYYYFWNKNGDHYNGDSVYYSDHYRDIAQYVVSQTIKDISLYSARTVVQSLAVNQLEKYYDCLNLKDVYEIRFTIKISQFRDVELLGSEEVRFTVKNDKSNRLGFIWDEQDDLQTGITEVR